MNDCDKEVSDFCGWRVDTMLEAMEKNNYHTDFSALIDHVADWCLEFAGVVCHQNCEAALMQRQASTTNLTEKLDQGDVLDEKSDEKQRSETGGCKDQFSPYR